MWAKARELIEGGKSMVCANVIAAKGLNANYPAMMSDIQYSEPERKATHMKQFGG